MSSVRIEGIACRPDDLRKFLIVYTRKGVPCPFPPYHEYDKTKDRKMRVGEISQKINGLALHCSAQSRQEE